MASVPEYLRKGLLRWAEKVMARAPDVIERRNTYFERWHITPEWRLCRIYLHRFLGSDNEALHDHEYANLSLVLDGGYYEQQRDGTEFIAAGRIYGRWAKTPHRVVMGDRPAISLFLCGPRLNIPAKRYPLPDHHHVNP